jgi:hypothetical protein
MYVYRNTEARSWNHCCREKATNASHIRKESTVRLLKRKLKFIFKVLFLSDSPYHKLLFYTVSTIIKAFIITGHQFMYPPSHNF